MTLKAHLPSNPEVEKLFQELLDNPATIEAINKHERDRALAAEGIVPLAPLTGLALHDEMVDWQKRICDGLQVPREMLEGTLGGINLAIARAAEATYLRRRAARRCHHVEPCTCGEVP